MNGNDLFVMNDRWALRDFVYSDFWIKHAPRIYDSTRVVRNRQEIARDVGPGVMVDKAYWESASWNPLPGYTFVDPNAGEKPTWDELVQAYKAYVVERGLHPGAESRQEIERIRSDAASAPTLSDVVYVGDGLEHMPGLIHLLDAAGNAGRNMPLVVMRDPDDHSAKTMYLQREARELISSLATHRNLVESAYNSIFEEFAKIQARYDDTSLDAALRYDAAIELDEFQKAYPAKLAAEMTRLESADTLPEDIDELREKYSERLEAAATKRFALIKNSTTQQGVDLDPSCFDQAEGSRLISQHKQLGQINLARADTRKR